MKTLFPFFLFTISNIAIYIFAVISKSLPFTGWKIALIPLICFPLIYLANITFSGAFIISEKVNISTAIAGVSNLAIGVIVFMMGHFIYYKQAITIQMILGASLILVGAFLINWR